MESVRKKRFQLSSLSPEIKEVLAGYIKQLGGTYLNKQIFTRQVSHIICGKPNRSEKYLAGCVSGRWILKKEFIEDSFQQGTWLPEEDYEWSAEDLEDGSPLEQLYSAPRKWRNALKDKEGGLKNWNAFVHVKDMKMKKAYERLLEAGCATICKKKTLFQDMDQAKGITHVFVEPGLKHDVLSLEKNGVLCVSPDYIPEYIIQIAEEQVLNYLTMRSCEQKNIMNIIKFPSKSVSGKQKQKGVLPGKENEPLEDENKPIGINKVVNKGIKRKLPPFCNLCQAKRQKKMSVSFPYCQSFIKKEANEKLLARNKPPAFPVYISNIVESHVEEGYFVHALESLLSSLSKKHAPSSGCLHMVMNKFLLNSPSKWQAMQSYHFLQETLLMHPPSSCQSLYLRAFVEVSEDADTKANKDVVLPWEFLHKVIRLSLKNVSKDDKTKARTQENAQILLQFFDGLFKQDASSVLQTPPMIFRIVWPAGMVTNASKQITKQFVTLCYQSVKLAGNNETKSILCQVLLDLLSLALVSLKNLGEKTEKECCECIAQQLFEVMSRNGGSKTNKLFLQGCHSAWLKMRITELMLENFDKRLVPQKHRIYFDKKLSLMKIVSCYFFLLPKTTDCKSTQRRKMSSFKKQNSEGDMEHKKQLERKRLERKNKKGETALHVACIHNDITSVEEILKQDFDVNTTDNAGWTALHEACNHGHVKCVEKMLNYHERTNKVDLFLSPPCGTTALHDAVINNHLAVVKLLVQSGGLKLLEAKTTSGKTAFDLATTQEMADILASETQTLKEEDDSFLNQPHAKKPLPEQYDKILNRDENSKVFVTMADCQEYLFLVSQLLQCYIKENVLSCIKMEDDKMTCKNCKTDFECYGCLSGYVDNVEQHAKMITKSEELSEICKMYITSMKECLLLL